MAKLSTQTRLRKVLKKTIEPQTGWLDIFDAVTGRADGTVLTGVAGLIYVRNLLNGQVLAVYNSSVSNRANMQVEVGRRVDQPGVWRIKGEKQLYTTPSTGNELSFHASQHRLVGADPVFLDRKQIIQLSVLVRDAAGFIVTVYGGTPLTANGYAMIETQDWDLSSYVVTVGAKFIAIESDNDGNLSVHDGSPFDAPAIATTDDFPVPAAGKYTRAFVLFYEGQVLLSNNDILVPMPPDFNPANFLSEVNWGDIGGTLADQPDLQEALDLRINDAPANGEIYGRRDSMWEIIPTNNAGADLLMEDGVAFPPVPLTNETGDDWIYDS